MTSDQMANEARLNALCVNINAAFESFKHAILAGDNDGRRRQLTSDGMRHLVMAQGEMEQLGIWRPVRNEVL